MTTGATLLEQLRATGSRFRTAGERVGSRRFHEGRDPLAIALTRLGVDE